MANFIIINEQEVNYNLILKIKIEDYPQLAGKESAYPIEGYKSFNFLRDGIGAVSKVDWGDGTVENNPTSKVKLYNTGEYIIKMKLESLSKMINLSSNNISEIIEFPYDLIEDESYIRLDLNKIPKGGLLSFLQNINKRIFPPIDSDNNYRTGKYVLYLNGQLGHYRRDGYSANSKGYIERTIPGKEFLIATEEEKSLYSRNQEELDAAFELIDKGWMVQMSFDDHYRVLMPKYTSGIFAQGEMGDINLGCEIFHFVPEAVQINNPSGRSYLINYKVVRVNKANGYWNDERFSSQPLRQIVPQKIYSIVEVKRNGSSNFEYLTDIDVTDDGTGKYKKGTAMYHLSKELQNGDVIRAKIYSKWNEISSSNTQHCSQMFDSKANHTGITINYTLTYQGS